MQQQDIVFLGPKNVGKTALTIQLQGAMGAQHIDCDKSQHNYCATSWLDNSAAAQPKKAENTSRIFDTDGAATIAQLEAQQTDAPADSKWSDEALYVIMMSISEPRNKKEGLELLKEMLKYGNCVCIVAEDKDPQFMNKFSTLLENNPWVLPVPFKRYEGMNGLYEQGLHVGAIKNTPQTEALIDNVNAIKEAIESELQEATSGEAA